MKPDPLVTTSSLATAGSRHFQASCIVPPAGSWAASHEPIRHCRPRYVGRPRHLTLLKLPPVPLTGNFVRARPMDWTRRKPSPNLGLSLQHPPCVACHISHRDLTGVRSPVKAMRALRGLGAQASLASSMSTRSAN
jgi:hypothetical protein